MTIPQEALDAAQKSVRASYGVIGGVMTGQIRYALEAAAPVIAAAERERACRIAESYLDGNVLREFADEIKDG